MDIGLGTHCTWTITRTCEPQVKTKDREQKATNVQRTMQGVLLALLTLAAAALMGMIFTTRFIDTL